MNASIARDPLATVKQNLRAGLLEQRRAAHAQNAANLALARQLRGLLEARAPRAVGFYWPLPGEFDARETLLAWLAGNPARRAALPVIAARHAPLAFHAWTPDTPMRTGAHRIPEPDGSAPLVPDLLLIPCVGFDAGGYRLGYGGGYYDRTLAAWPGGTRPYTVGVAFEACRVASLPRGAHDLPLDCIVTEAAQYGARDA